MKRFLMKFRVLPLILALLLTGCAAPAGSITDDTDTTKPPVQSKNDGSNKLNVKELAAAAKLPTGAETDEDFKKAITDFSQSLFQLSVKDFATSGDNLILSPLSVTYALTLTANGALGDTLGEFNALNGGIDVSRMNEQLYSLALRLAASKESTVSIANGIWSNNRELNPQFAWIAEQYYNAKAAMADFSDPGTAKEINEWVSEKTDGMIPTLVDELDPDMVMVLLNTVLFDGVWEVPYEEYAVREREFHNADGSTATAEFLCSTERAYFTLDDAKGFIKPYRDNFSFIALLPAEGTDIYEYAQTLDVSRAIEASQTVKKAECYLPKFEFDAKIDLKGLLQEMGFEKAFTDEAELDGLIVDDTPLCISDILQKAKITLDEHGTKAAAVTEIMIRATSAMVEEIPVIDLNRPFCFMIVDNDTSLPLFMGLLAGLE